MRRAKSLILWAISLFGNLAFAQTPARDAGVDASHPATDAGANDSHEIIAAPATADELTQEGRTFFMRGVAMFKRGHFEAALEAFTAAYRFSPCAEVIYDLALTAEKLHRYQDAIDYYNEYLHAPGLVTNREGITRRIRELRALGH